MNLELKAEIIRRYGSQANFSTALRLDESLVSRVVRGRRTLEPEEQQKWALALGKKPADLFEE